jgi:hypothetical protein
MNEEKTVTTDKILYRRPILIESSPNGEGKGVMTLVKDKESGDIITGVTHVNVNIPVNDVITAQITYHMQDEKGGYIIENNDVVTAHTIAPVAGIKLSALETSYQDLSERASIQAMLIRPDDTNVFGPMCTAFQIEADGYTIRLTPAETIALGAYILSNQKEIGHIVELNKKPINLKKKSDLVVPPSRPKRAKKTAAKKEGQA